MRKEIPEIEKKSIQKKTGVLGITTYMNCTLEQSAPTKEKC